MRKISKRVIGKYNYEDHVFLDTSSNVIDDDTKYHELAHHGLTQGSLYGLLCIMLKYLGMKYEPYLLEHLHVLHCASELTQEITAIAAQCIYRRLIDPTTFEAYLSELRESNYYRKYCISGFDELITHERIDYNGTGIISAIAGQSMNIDITKATIDWANPNSLYKVIRMDRNLWPDSRFKRITRAVLEFPDLLSESFSLDSITDKLQIECTPRSKEHVFQMIDRLFSSLHTTYPSIDTANAKSRIMELIPDDIDGRPNIEEIERRILPLALNVEYTHPPRFNPISMDYSMPTATILLSGMQTDAYLYKINDGRDMIILYHPSIGMRYILSLERDRIGEFLLKYEGAIIVFHEDLNKLIETVFDHRIRYFIRYDGQYEYFRSIIRSYAPSVKKAHLHAVNSQVVAIFVLTDRGVIFTLQFTQILRSFIEDMVAGLYDYVNLEDDCMVDGIFYINDTDWCLYEKVILSCVDQKYINNAVDGKYIGSRIHIDPYKD